MKSNVRRGDVAKLPKAISKNAVMWIIENSV